MQKRIVYFLNSENILNTNQFGFQKDKSTSNAVLHLTNQIYKSIKLRESCCVIFLDLAKAFDTVIHSILLQKLKKSGIKGSLLKWFASYLKKRKQCVVIDEF